MVADPPPKYLLNLTADLPSGAVKLLPSAAAQMAQKDPDQVSPRTRCLPPGIPESFSTAIPFKILELPRQVTILYEESNSFRQIFTDGRALPEDLVPTWMGYSIGYWDGDTFVVESTGFNDRIMLDAVGHPHTPALRLIERYHRLDTGHMEIEITVDDPGAYQEPWTVTLPAILVVDGELIEYVCLENERDVEHIEAVR